MLMQNMLLILCIIAVATYIVAWIEILDAEKEVIELNCRHLCSGVNCNLD